MAKTYDSIQTVTISNNTTTSISFNSIANTYTDLRIIGSYSFFNTGSGGSNKIGIRLNNLAVNASYRTAAMRSIGNSRTATGVNAGAPYFSIEPPAFDGADGTGSIMFDLNNYATTSASYKTGSWLAGGCVGNGAGGYVPAIAFGSAAYIDGGAIAVSSIQIIVENNNYPFKQNSYFTLYGITAG